MTAPGPVIRLDALGGAARVLVAVAASIEGPAWLVGGTVRDLLIGRPVHDFDLALPGGSLAAARRLADRIGGAFVPIGPAHGVARVVVGTPGTGGPPIRVDLADFRGPGLEADLRGRDVTIDALAVPLGTLVTGAAGVVDPTGGLADLAAGLLRACGPFAFVDDPLRVLRVLRFAHGLGFRIEEGTERLARDAVRGLATVSAERVRDELTGLLRLPRTAPAVRQADDWLAVDAILPEASAMRAAGQSAPHRFTVWEHSLRALEAVDRLLADLTLLAPHEGRLGALLAEELGTGLTRREVLKLAVLLHDVAKPETRSVDPDGRVRFIGHDRLGADRVRTIAERLAWPGRAIEVLVRLVRHHLRPMHLGMLETISARARYRFYRDVGEEVPALVCLTIADAAGTDGRPPAFVYRDATRELLRSLLAGQAEATREAGAPPLLRGEDVMTAFGLPPGPPIGRLLRQAREAQALGVVGTRDEALAWLARQPAADSPTPTAPPADGATTAAADNAEDD